MIPFTELRRGDKGPDVKKLQKLLNEKLMSPTRLKEDGEFGPATFNAVKIFQKNIGLEADGVAGFWTWTRFYLSSQILPTATGTSGSSSKIALPPKPSDHTATTLSTAKPTLKTNKSLDLQKAVDWINKNAQKKSSGKCAKYVRLALEAGGGDTSGHPVSAKNWGPTLEKMEFEIVSNEGYVAELGDVVVFQPPANASAKHGHIQMFNGKCWVSDFFQQNFKPNRRENPQYKIYRLK